MTRRGGSAAPIFALTARTSNGGNLLTNGVVNGLDPPTGSLTGDVMFHDVGALALTLLNVDRGAEEGAERDAATADGHSRLERVVLSGHSDWPQATRRYRAIVL